MDTALQHGLSEERRKHCQEADQRIVLWFAYCAKNHVGLVNAIQWQDIESVMRQSFEQPTYIMFTVWCNQRGSQVVKAKSTKTLLSKCWNYFLQDFTNWTCFTLVLSKIGWMRQTTKHIRINWSNFCCIHQPNNYLRGLKVGIEDDNCGCINPEAIQN